MKILHENIHSSFVMGGSRPLAALLLASLLPGAHAQCNANQEFFDEDGDFLYIDLESGVPANRTLCPLHWVWYRVRTRPAITWPKLQQRGSVWSEEPFTESVYHSLSIAADAGYDEVSRRYTTVSLLVVNNTPPVDDQRLASAEPYDPVRFGRVYSVYKPITDRETLAFGYNDTLGPLCQLPLAEYVYIALRCLNPLGFGRPCAYNLTVTLLPHTLRNGMEFDAYLNPIEQAFDYQQSSLFNRLVKEQARHFFHISVTAYERLVRVDEDL